MRCETLKAPNLHSENGHFSACDLFRRLIHFIQGTLLRVAHTVLIVCTKIKKAFWESDGDNARSSEFTVFLRSPKSWMRENVRPANFSLMRGNDQKSYGAKWGLQLVYGGWVWTWMFCSLKKVTVTLALWALPGFGILFLSLHFFFLLLSFRHS